MEAKGIAIRSMREEDIADVLNLYREEKWLDGRSTLLAWFTFDPQGFKVAETDTGEIVGMIFGINHCIDFYIVGGYIVKRDYRGKGIGSKLWAVIMNRIGTRNAALIAVKSMVEKYQKLQQFKHSENRWKIWMNATKDEVISKYLSGTPPENVVIVPFQESHLPFIYTYDSSITGYDRRVALECYFKNNSSKAFVAFKKGACVGFGLIQGNLFTGCHVGPLYADNAAVAEVLLKKLIDSFPLKHGFEMTTLSTHFQANNLLKKLRCTFETEECTRLYKGKVMEVNTSPFFGLILDYAPF